MAKKNKTISKIEQDLVLLTIITLLLVVLLKPMVVDKLRPRGVDALGSMGATHQLSEYFKETGKHALWNPYIFSGMPSYHRIGPVAPSVDTLLNYLSKHFSIAFIYYLFASFGSYFLFRYLKMSPVISFIATIIFILMPHYKSLYIEGHFAKFRAVMIMPWVLLTFMYFLDNRVQDKPRNFLSAALFSIALGNQIRTQHYQIVFYTAFFIFALGIYPFLKDLIQKKYLVFAKSTGLLVGAIILGMGMAAQPLFLAEEYIPYSKRGKTVINLYIEDKK